MQNQETSSSGGGGLSSFEKLDGSTNYGTWKFQLEMYLIHEDLWMYTSTEPDLNNEQQKRKDQKARANICLMVKPHCLVHVMQASTAKQAWNALKVAFEDKGINNRCRLLGRLVSLKLEQFSSVQAYVTEIMTIAQSLRDIGKEVDDEMLAALMLQGLSKEYTPLKIAIENSNIELMSDYVKTNLLQLDAEAEDEKR